jgi:hypothetical protein
MVTARASNSNCIPQLQSPPFLPILMVESLIQFVYDVNGTLSKRGAFPIHKESFHQVGKVM